MEFLAWLQGHQLSPISHLFENHFDRAHYLILVQQHTALLLFHTVTDPFPDRGDQPEVFRFCFPDFTPEKVKGDSACKVFV